MTSGEPGAAVAVITSVDRRGPVAASARTSNQFGRGERFQSKPAPPTSGGSAKDALDASGGLLSS